MDRAYPDLKAAAILLASAPESARRALVEAYSREYCEIRMPEFCAGGFVVARYPDWIYRTRADIPKASGMYVLLRVLFVVPPDYWRTYSGGSVHVDPGAHVLRIKRWNVTEVRKDNAYRATWEYDYFATHFPRRSRAAIEALEILQVEDGGHER